MPFHWRQRIGGFALLLVLTGATAAQMPPPPPPGWPPPPPPADFSGAAARTPPPTASAPEEAGNPLASNVPQGVASSGDTDESAPIESQPAPEPSAAAAVQPTPAAAAIAAPAALGTQNALAGSMSPAATHDLHSRRSLTWLLLPLLAAVLLAWWITLRRSRALAQQTAHLSRQQRVLESAHRHLKEKSQQLRQLSTQDPLTGALNRLAFGTEMRERLDHLARYNQPLNLILFDLDHFKIINDRQGHTAGDRALLLVAGIVREHLVSDDLFGRFGGDEFMIACAGQALADTVSLAESLRLAVAERAPRHDPPLPGLSLSIGVAQASIESGYDADALFERADAALYEAKQRGRNNVVVADAELRRVPSPAAIARHL